MAQLINYNDLAVMVYHTVPSKAGTDDFEHKTMVPLSYAVHAKKTDGSDDPDTLVIACGVPRCPMTVHVPLTGSEEAQRFHAKVRHARKEQPSYQAAIDSVVADVTARGHVARLKG